MDNYKIKLKFIVQNLKWGNGQFIAINHKIIKINECVYLCYYIALEVLKEGVVIVLAIL